MKISEFLERFVYIRRCAGCGVLMGYEAHKDAFCPSCRIKWEMAKSELCVECARPVSECDCMPKNLSRTGLLALKKLVLYLPKSPSKPQNRILYFIKHNKNKRVAGFLASQLSSRVFEIMRETSLEREGFVLTYIPRSKRALLEYGFDQSELICRALSDICGIKLVKVFERDRTSKEQKKLDALGRSNNASSGIDIREGAISEIDGKIVILFDDIVSSGASMVRAASLLRENKARNLFGLSVAFTQIIR